jgi:hypothetical protein
VERLPPSNDGDDEMTDKELLELAAKAAGIELMPMQINNVTKQGDDRFIGYMTKADEWPRGWFDPLTDDGDALRLAVKLKLCFGPNFEGDLAVCFGDDGRNITEAYGADPYAATRRAITRAAAEIGKSMP